MMELQGDLFGPLPVETTQTSSAVLCGKNSREKKGRKITFEDYDGFVEKFKPKKTTDDCYTPEKVYNSVLDFVGRITDLEGREIVRPFWPGADFTQETYPERCVVVDNPPFSLLSKIIRWFCAHGIDFFIFAPALTIFVARDCDVTYIVSDSSIIYENGAVVRTGFITNLVPDVRVWVCPQLGQEIKRAQAVPSKETKKFIYPDNIITGATLLKLAHYGVEFRVTKSSCYPISDSDGAKMVGRSLFGGGYLLSERAAAERAAAEHAAAEHAAAERAAAERAAAERAAADVIVLSERERQIIKKLD